MSTGTASATQTPEIARRLSVHAQLLADADQLMVNHQFPDTLRDLTSVFLVALEAIRRKQAREDSTCFRKAVVIIQQGRKVCLKVQKAKGNFKVFIRDLEGGNWCDVTALLDHQMKHHLAVNIAEKLGRNPRNDDVLLLAQGRTAKQTAVYRVAATHFVERFKKEE